MTRFGSQRQRRSLLNIFYHILLLWTKEMDALANFSSYLLRIIKSQSSRACDGQQLRLQCPRHSSISVHSAFYGYSETQRCSADFWTAEDRARNKTCSSLTALQKVLSECQGHRDCQLPVNYHVFGQDPCPGTPKNLEVSYKCKPTEHRRKVACEGETLTLRCKSPRVLNIYSVVYGRQLGEEHVCVSDPGGDPPPFECFYHGAVEVVSQSCYGRERCVITVNDHTFRNPCAPGTRKYLSVLYACVPVTLMKEADPKMFTTTSSPKWSTEKGVVVFPKGSQRPDKKDIIVSNSLMVYGLIKEHPELVALLFVSSVCVGLLCALLTLSMKVSCAATGPRDTRKQGTPSRREAPEARQSSDSDVTDGDSEPSSSLSDRKDGGWETAEATELAERIERRDRVIQEIWMNAYLNGTAHSWPAPVDTPTPYAGHAHATLAKLGHTTPPTTPCALTLRDFSAGGHSDCS